MRESKIDELKIPEQPRESQTSSQIPEIYIEIQSPEPIFGSEAKKMSKLEEELQKMLSS